MLKVFRIGMTKIKTQNWTQRLIDFARAAGHHALDHMHPDESIKEVELKNPYLLRNGLDEFVDVAIPNPVAVSVVMSNDAAAAAVCSLYARRQ